MPKEGLYFSMSRVFRSVEEDVKDTNFVRGQMMETDNIRGKRFIALNSSRKSK